MNRKKSERIGKESRKNDVRFEKEGIHAYNSACIHARVSSPVRAARELRPPAWNVGSDVRPVPFVGCVSCEDFDRCPFFSHS